MKNFKINKLDVYDSDSLKAEYYKKSFKGHSIDFLLGTTYNSRFRDRQYNRYIDIPEYLEVLVINGLDGGTPDESNDIIEDEETRIFSLLTRLNYNYKSKYYFTASLRRDASSNFTRANRVGYFPSAAVSWNAHKEDFLKDLDIFSQLKFKFGYGRTGNDRIPSIAVFDVLTDLNASYFFNGQTVQGQRTTEFGSNPNLFWETTDQFNFGADIGLFDGRISLTAELYQKNNDIFGTANSYMTAINVMQSILNPVTLDMISGNTTLTKEMINIDDVYYSRKVNRN